LIFDEKLVSVDCESVTVSRIDFAISSYVIIWTINLIFFRPNPLYQLTNVVRPM